MGIDIVWQISDSMIWVFVKVGDSKKYGAFNRETVLLLFGNSGWVRRTYPRISVSMQDYGVNPSLSWIDVIYPVNWIELVAAQTRHCASVKWQFLVCVYSLFLSLVCPWIACSSQFVWSDLEKSQVARHTRTARAKSKRNAGNMDLAGDFQWSIMTIWQP